MVPQEGTEIELLGFSESKADTSLFILQKFNSVIYILIYVDDILITGSIVPIIHDTIQSLQATFAVKDLGRLNYFLGVEALWCTDDLYLTQRKYIADLLKRSKMENAKPCSSPMASNCHLTSTEGRPFEDISLYRSVVGSMQYLAFTRLDLAFAVHRVSKFMQNPLDTHWLAVKRILYYLKHSISTGWVELISWATYFERESKKAGPRYFDIIRFEVPFNMWCGGCTSLIASGKLLFHKDVDLYHEICMLQT